MKVFAPIRKLSNESNEEMLANEVRNTLAGVRHNLSTGSHTGD